MLRGRKFFSPINFALFFLNFITIFCVLTYFSVSGGVPLFLFSDWRPEEAEEDVFLKISTTFVIFLYKQTKLGTAPSWKSRKIGRTSTFFDKFQPHFVINSSAKILVLNQFDHPWFNLSIFWRYCEILPVTHTPTVPSAHAICHVFTGGGCSVCLIEVFISYFHINHCTLEAVI